MQSESRAAGIRYVQFAADLDTPHRYLLQVFELSARQNFDFQPGRVRVLPIVLSTGRRSIAVVDSDGRPMEVVALFLSYLRTVDCSPNTIASYGSHLALGDR